MRDPLQRRAARHPDRRRAHDRGRGGLVAMPFGYPVMLELRSRRCVVIGETAVRERKVEGLLAAGADDVVVIAPGAREVPPGVEVRRRAWLPGDLDGAWLVVASSDDA